MGKRYLVSLFALTVFAGCSGGGSTTPLTSPRSVNPAPLPTANAATLSTATIGGNPAFVSAAQLPVYIFTADGSDASVCTAGCLAAWPAVLAPAGATLSAGFSAFKRSDDGQMQLAFNGQPLYTFVGDSADKANGVGDVVPDNGTSGASGTFNLAVPTALAGATATPAPSAAPIATSTPFHY